MREKIAILLCVLTMAAASALSVVFAVRHNAGATATRPASDVSSRAKNALPENADVGQKLFETQKCGACHSFAGVGNPRLPLDDVGRRLSDLEIRSGIMGSGSATNKLPALALKRKRAYQALSEDQLRLLVEYLQTGSH